MPQSEKAYAKINLFLDVLAKRPDGYHDIGTLFQAIDLHDVLEFHEAPQNSLTLTYNAPQDYPVESDLVYKVAKALQEQYQPKQGAHLHLIKKLPIGAGLGGGSADAAAALRLLNREWNLQLDSHTLCSIGARFGADIPFLVEGGSKLATGIGDQLTTLPPIPVGAWQLVVATPLCAVPTKAAYAGIRPSGEERWNQFLQTIHGKPQLDIRDIVLYNKFEETVFPQYAPIVELRDAFLAAGATSALMSGSGASVFGFFESLDAAKAFLAINRERIRFGELAQFKELC